MTSTIVIGAGISGLYTAYRLAEKGDRKPVILEKTSSVGGMAKSLKHGEFILDFGPHKIYSIEPGVIPEYQRVMDNKLLTVQKKNSIYLQGKHITFPLQPLKAPFQIRWGSIIKCGISFSWAQMKSLFSKKPILTYEDYFIAGFGKAGYELIFRDLADKVWGDPKTLAEELARKRVPVPSVFKLLQSMGSKKAEISAGTFLYPENGFGAVGETLAKKLIKLGGSVLLNSSPTRITIKDNKVSSITFEQEGSSHIIKNPSTVVSTIHILDLLNLLEPAPPAEVIEAASKLRFRGLSLVFVFFDKERVLEQNWIFFPEKEFIFNRVSEPKLSSSAVCPAGKTYLIAEVTLDPANPLFEDEKTLTEKVLQDMIKAGLFKREDITGTIVKKARRIYPVYDVDYRKNLSVVLGWLDSVENLYSIGRPGLFNYNNTDHCIDTGMKLADLIIRNGTREEWRKVRESFDSYRIID